MLEDAAKIRRVIVACGYVDYPRSIVIREELRRNASCTKRL